MPIRQFLKKEGIDIAKEKISARIKVMENDPNPFDWYPPKPLTEVMAWESITRKDLRLMIMTDIGMSMWGEREWQQQFPTLQFWNEYCSEKGREFRNQSGKFARIPFIIDRLETGTSSPSLSGV